MKKAAILGRLNNPHMGHMRLLKVAFDIADEANIVFGCGKKNADYGLRLCMFERLMQISFDKELLASKTIRFWCGHFITVKRLECDYIVFGGDKLEANSGIMGAAKYGVIVPRSSGAISSTELRADLLAHTMHVQEMYPAELFDTLQTDLQVEAARQYFERLETNNEF